MISNLNKEKTNQKKYHSHRKSHDIDYIFEEVNNLKIKKDRYYMTKELIPMATYLKDREVQMKDFITFLKKKIKINADDIFCVISDALERIAIKTNNRNNMIIFMKPRQLKKANFKEKNILINRIAHEYPEIMKDCLSSYLIRHKTNMSDLEKEDIINEFQSLIYQLNNPINNNDDYFMPLFVNNDEEPDNLFLNYQDLFDSMLYQENNLYNK